MPDTVRSLVRWLFLHRRLRSRQRGSRMFTPKNKFSRAARHLWADHLPVVLSVFIRTTRSAFRSTSAKPFGFGSGRIGQRHSAPSVPQTIASPHPFHLPVPVKIPVAISTVKSVYTRFFVCQVENTLTITLYLRACCGKTVDISQADLWIKVWKTGQLI